MAVILKHQATLVAKQVEISEVSFRVAVTPELREEESVDLVDSPLGANLMMH